MFKFCNISVNFEDTKMVDHILEIPRLVVCGVLTGIIQSYNNEKIPHGTKTSLNLEVVIVFQCLLGPPGQYINSYKLFIKVMRKHCKIFIS